MTRDAYLDAEMAPPGWAGRAWRWLVDAARGPSWRWRLHSLYAEILTRKQMLDAHADAGQRPGWWSSAQQLVAEARKAADRKKLDKGWRFAHGAEILALGGASMIEVDARAMALREEAETKLRGWRQEAIKELLAAPLWSAMPDDARKARLAEALDLRAEQSSDMWHHNDILRRQIVLVTIFMMLFGAGLAYQVLHLDTEGALMRGIIAAGLLGGSMSAFLAFAAVPEARGPEEILGYVVTFVRVFFGGAAAVLVYFLLDSPLASMVFAFDLTHDGTILLVAFGSGFSERIIRKTAAKVGA